MAARMNKLHQADVRAKIQASQLINRLTDHVLGDVEMTPTQVQAAKILLGKSLPDLQSVELGGPDGEAIKFEDIRRPKLTKEEWMRAHGVGAAAGPAK